MKHDVGELLESIRKSWEAEPEKLVDLVTLTVRKNDVPCAAWSFLNRMIVMARGYTDCRTYKVWQKLGRTVKAGEKAVWIFQPYQIEVKDKNAPVGTPGKMVTLFKLTPRFDITQSEGAEVVVESTKAPVFLPPLFEVAEAFGIGVKWQGYVGMGRGWFSPDRNEIGLCTDDTRTFFHELVHAIHDKVLPGDMEKDYGISECVAEIGALCLLTMYSPKEVTNAYSFKYVQGWAKDNPAKSIMKVTSKVDKIVKAIVATAEQKEKAA
jgi:hypothetical protein